jgi:hypothetical protein
VSVVLTAIAAVVVGIVLVGVVLNLATDPDVDVNLGSDVFEVGRANRLAPEVAERGPLLFQALRGTRDIFVQHSGKKAREGWMTFDAHAPGSDRTCQLQWRPNRRVFVDPCDDKVYPADGLGLPHYRTSVNAEGVIVVDLRSRVPYPTTTTTAAAATTTSPG